MITTELPYGPIVEDGKFSFTTFYLEWHTFGKPCQTCEDATLDDEWPKRCCPCGGLVHHQILAPYMGDQENGYEEDWMCEECGRRDRYPDEDES